MVEDSSTTSEQVQSRIPIDATALPVRESATRAVPVIRLIGPKAARKAVRQQFGRAQLSEHHGWQGLSASPAVFVDAKRFVYLSPDGVRTLWDAVTGSAPVALPASNASPWPLCGLDPPSGDATIAELVSHAARIRDVVGTDRIGADCLLPAVFAVADASRIAGRPIRVGDLTSEAVVVSSVWCHSREVPKISLAMIVKNEEAGIERVIASAQGVADEVVVYDTGSTDDTVRLARLAGAAVRCGYWDDDFSRARNESFAMSRGDWILVLDGDDEFVADVAERAQLRSLVDQAGPDAVLSLLVRSPAPVGSDARALEFFGRRLFPRTARYRNRVHEAAMFPDGRPSVELSVEGPMIVHSGYVAGNDARVERNLRIAELRLDGAIEPKERSLARYEYARALMNVGRTDEAEVTYRSVVDAAPSSEEAACSLLFLALMTSGRDGLGATTELLGPLLLEGGKNAVASKWFIGSLTPDHHAAIELIRGVDHVDSFPIMVSAAEVGATRAFRLSESGQFAEAAKELQRLDRPHRFNQSWWVAAATVAAGEPAGAERLLTTALADDLTEAATALASGPVEGAHELAVALWEQFGAMPPLVAYFAVATARCGFFAAFDARFRLASVGQLDVGDPLEHLLEGTGHDPLDRFLSALVLDFVSDGKLHRASHEASGLSDEMIEFAVRAVREALPECLPAAIDALGVTQGHRYALAAAGAVVAGEPLATHG